MELSQLAIHSIELGYLLDPRFATTKEITWQEKRYRFPAFAAIMNALGSHDPPRGVAMLEELSMRRRHGAVRRS